MKRRYKKDDPDLVQAFKKHCEDGWSPYSFTAQLVGGEKAYKKIRDTNEEFRAIILLHQKNPIYDHITKSKTTTH